MLAHWGPAHRCLARSAVCAPPPPHWGAPRLGDGTTSLCHLHHLIWPYHPLARFFPITAMPMILNCFCLSLLRTLRSRRGSRTVSLIYPHGKSPPSAEPGQNGTDGLPNQTGSAEGGG